MSIRHAPHEARRPLVAGGAALVVHALLLVASMRPVPQRTTTTYAERPESPVEAIEIALLEERIGIEETNASRDGRAAEPVGATASRAALAPSRESEPATVEVPSTGEAPAPTAAPVMLFVPSAGSIQDLRLPPGSLLGAGGVQAEAPPSTFRSAAPDAPSRAEAKRSVDRSLREGMSGRDAELGLGPEGPVLRALHDATHGGLAPERGNATFLAVVDGSGLVVSLRLVASTGGERGWAETRDRAARAIEGTRLTLRGAAKGAELRISVDSDIRLPSGSKPRAPVRPTLTDSHVVLPENLPGGGTADVVKTYTVAEFDVADIGAKPRRVVHTRVVSVTTF